MKLDVVVGRHALVPEAEARVLDPRRVGEKARHAVAGDVIARDRQRMAIAQRFTSPG